MNVSKNDKGSSVDRLSKETKYDVTLRKLMSEIEVLVQKYLPELHNTCPKNRGPELSHKDLIDKLKQDIMDICSGILELLFDERNEEEIDNEILEYNYNLTDIMYMKQVENIDLYAHINNLNKYCIKRTDTAWSQFGIDDILHNGKVDLGPMGSKRTQFCKCCREPIFLMSNLVYHSNQRKRTQHNSRP
jgi:hypothetical protein